MKKLILLAAIVSSMAASAWACDLCGYQVSLNPNYNQSQIGLRFRYRNFVGHHTHSADGAQHGADRETYLTTEMWARWCPNPRWRVQMLLPVAQNTAYDHGAIENRVIGLGDASVLVYRQLLERADTAARAWQQRLFGGIGIAAPIGRWQPKDTSEYEPMIMPGTGAWAAMGGLSYMLRKGAWGLGLDYNLRISTQNAREYRFASRHNLNANLYYQLRWGEFAILPFLGAYAEYAGMDRFQGEWQQNTGGLAGFGTTGIELYFKHLSISFAAQLPARQALHGQQGQNKTRLNGGVFYSF